MRSAVATSYVLRIVSPASRTPWLLVLLLVLAGSSGCGATATKARAVLAGVVPWVNRPLRLYVIPEPKLIRYPTSAPPCRAGQLRVSQGRTGVGLGNQLEELVFTNVAASPCLLRGYPAISAETSTGSRRLRPQRGGTYFGQLVPADLPPGGHVFLDLATSTGCEGGREPAVRYHHLLFTLPHGGSLRAEQVSISEDCGLSMSDFGLPRRYSQPRAAPGTAGTLRARLWLPASVRVGTIFRYTVTLSNPTKTTVVLHPCPGYSEGLYASGLVVRRSFTLNCQSVHAIPAHGQVRYAMRLTVPRRAAPAIAKIGWNVNTPTGPFAGQVVQITAG